MQVIEHDAAQPAKFETRRRAIRNFDVPANGFRGAAARTHETERKAHGLLEMRRRLTVILASDVAGYSRLVAADEEDTIHRFKRSASVLIDLVTKHQGRVFNTAGDATLAEFDSAVNAARCAIDFQDANNAQNAAVAEGRKLLFRIGIALGDVLVAENGDLLGDAVNIAARLEGIAEPGGICISDDIRIHVLNKIRLNLIDLGEQTLRNIPRTIRAFKLSPEVEAAPRPQAKQRRPLALRRPGVRTASALALGVIMLAIAVGYLRFFPNAVGSNPAEATRLFDPASVPLVSDRVRGNFANFNQLPDFKAIAISYIGWGIASGAVDVASAEREAIDRCKQRDQRGDCRIYARGSQVVLPQLPLPLAADLHVVPLDIPLAPADVSGIKGMPTPAGLDAFIKAKDHKALAVSGVGFSSQMDRPELAEAIRLSVERCSDYSHAACLLVSVDGFLTVRIPQSHRAVRPYTLASDPDMSETDKQRIGAIYAGKDWRALVRGGSKRWYAVGEAESEASAVDRALKTCRAAESECALHAVGNFRVDDKQ
jgi:class 3 adenylate cyclase